MVDASLTMPSLTPQLLLGLTALLLFVIDTVSPTSERNDLLAGVAAIGTLAATAVASWFLYAGTGSPDTGGAITEFESALVVDTFSLFFAVVVGVVTTLVIAGSYDYVAGERHLGEYYSLVLLAATGMSLMASANSLVTAFVALELSSLPSYVLVGYFKHNRGSVEGALKYFLIGALSSAVFAYGISLVYGVTGVLRFDLVAAAVGDTDLVGVLGVGVLLVAGGVAFKTASVPFHFWAPEAYEGAPAPISAFLSSASKAAGFALAFRLFVEAFPLAGLPAGLDWSVVFAALAVLTMTLGNFAAATQETVKRMLAYSSVGQAGYALIGLAALGGGQDALVLGAAMTHLFVYGFMNTGAFLVVALADHWGLGRRFEDFNGLWRRAPVACLAMTVFLFSLAGLPVGAGFLSKYVLFMGAVSAGYAWLAAVAAVTSALSLFYYARLAKAMWIEEPTGESSGAGVAADGGAAALDRPVGLYVGILVAALGTVLLLAAFDPVVQTAIDAAGALLES
jgi:NADH-quinone oxidoreductase subunit N